MRLDLGTRFRQVHVPRRAAAWLLAGLALAAALAPFAGPGSARPALACSCIDTPYEELLEEADFAFEGTVVKLSRASGGWLAQFRVESVIDGPKRTSAMVWTPANQAGCGLEFGIGESWVVLASERPGGDRPYARKVYDAHLCGGSHPA